MLLFVLLMCWVAWGKEVQTYDISTLISCWLEDYELPHCWINLDETAEFLAKNLGKEVEAKKYLYFMKITNSSSTEHPPYSPPPF